MKVRVCRLRRGRTARGCEGGRGWRRMARGRVPGDGTGSCAGRGCGARHGVVAAAWQHVWWNVSATALGAGDKNGRFSRGKRTAATTTRPSQHTPRLSPAGTPLECFLRTKLAVDGVYLLPSCPGRCSCGTFPSSLRLAPDGTAGSAPWLPAAAARPAAARPSGERATHSAASSAVTKLPCRLV